MFIKTPSIKLFPKNRSLTSQSDVRSLRRLPPSAPRFRIIPSPFSNGSALRSPSIKGFFATPRQKARRSGRRRRLATAPTCENLESVPATLRRHASQSHLPCIHPDRRFSASANGNFHLSQEPATPISTPPPSSQSESKSLQTGWSCRFSSQHLIPLLLQSSHLPGNSKSAPSKSPKPKLGT